MTQLRPNKRDTPRFYSTSIKLIEPSPPRLLSFQILSIFLSPSLSTIKIDGNRAVRREGLACSGKDKKIIWRWSTNAIDFWIYVGFHVSCFFLLLLFFFLSFPNRRISLNVPLRVLTMHRASAESEIAIASPLPVASINIYVFLTYSTHAGIRGILLFPFVRIVRCNRIGREIGINFLGIGSIIISS